MTGRRRAVSVRAFALAFAYRSRPELHRRLMLVACCALTAAAFGRFPNANFADNWFYAGVDGLVLIAAARDLVTSKRVHPVYLCALPLLMLGQVVAMSPRVRHSPAWQVVAGKLVRE